MTSRSSDDADEHTQAPDDTTPFDDAKTGDAIDDIASQDADELLAVQDEAASVPPPRPGFWRRLWHSKAFHWTVALAIIFGTAATAITPAARYWVLNTAGVQASTKVYVVDDLTHQPLRNVLVQAGQASAHTGSDDKAQVGGLRLGPATVTISRPGFASQTRNITVGWGSNPLGTVGLKAVGVQYTVQVQDYFTGKGLVNADITVESSDATARSDSNGKAILIMPGTDTGDLTITVSRDGYRSDAFTVKALTREPTPVPLVTSRKAVYVAKGSTYDLYSSDADGRNRHLLLAGTGRENSNISLVVSPDGSRVALVSTRDDQRSADGALLNTLTIVTTANGDNVTIAHAEQIRLIDWTGTRLVFEQVTPTAPPATRFSVIAYDYASTTRLQLANASKIGMVLGAQKSLYYTVSVNDADPLARPGLYKVNYDGAGKATLLDKDVWSLYRTDYNTLTVQTSDGWYSVNMASSISAPASPPAAYVSRVYVDNAAGTQSLWTDIRAGQGTLVRYDRQPPKDAEALRQTGLVGPMRWLTDDIAVFRVVNGTDSADYAVSVLGGGQAHRVADVVNTYGFNAGL